MNKHTAVNKKLLDLFECRNADKKETKTKEKRWRDSDVKKKQLKFKVQ